MLLPKKMVIQIRKSNIKQWDSSTDRKDNNGSYSKNNCRWASTLQQNNNKRNNIIVEIESIKDIKGVFYCNKIQEVQQMKKFWEIKNKSKDSADIYIYGEIGESFWGESVSATDFKTELDGIGEVENLNIYINSPGGSVFDGLAIHNILSRHKAYKTVHVDGLAASIASVIALAGDKLIIPENAFFMIHLPSAYSVGNATEFRKMADTLDQITEGLLNVYEGKSTKTREELLEMMKNETWMTGSEAKEYGFADEVETEKKIAACMSSDFFNRYKNVPENVVKEEVEVVIKPTQSIEDILSVYENKKKLNNRRNA